jgi:hypothetical protein
LNEGWKKFTNSRTEPYNSANAAAVAPPVGSGDTTYG